MLLHFKSTEVFEIRVMVFALVLEESHSDSLITTLFKR